MDKEFFREMIECASPSGREEMLQKCVYKHYKEDFDEFAVEAQGSLIGIYKKDADFKIMLAAHADEISLIVTGHNSDGTLEVQKNGGIKPKLYAGSHVRILTPEGIVGGVVACNGDTDEKAELKASELVVDLGCDTKEEAQELVPKGSYVVHDVGMAQLAKDRLAGRAFDDRIGVYIIFEAAKKAISMGADSGLLAAAVTGEETTGRGAYSSASRFKPDVCVTVDVTYANDYKGSGEQGDVALSKGGVICRGSVPNPRLNDLLAECAKELELPVQYEVFAGRTGTDADTMIKCNESVPQVLFSVPLRYMHSPIEMLSVADVDSMIDVLALFLKKLDGKYSLQPYEL